MQETIEQFGSLFPGQFIFFSRAERVILPGEEGGKLWVHEGESYENLRRLNQADGRAIFYAVNELGEERNERGKRKRTKRNVVRARAVWADIDGPRELPPEEGWPLKPSVIVNSSPGKYQVLWLTSTTDFTRWESVMEALVGSGGDKNAKDLARVLRVPGFLHQKAAPHVVTFRVLRERPYEWEVISTAFSQSHRTTAPVLPTPTEEGDDAIGELLAQSASGEHSHGPILGVTARLVNHVKGDSSLSVREVDTIFRWVSERDTSVLPLVCRLGVRNGLSRESITRLAECLLTARTYPTEVEDAVRDAWDKPLREEEEWADVPDVVGHQFPAEMDWPPGMMGEMAKQVFGMVPATSPRIAIPATIGLIAGVVGRSYQVSGTGLNVYIAILAETAYGKEVVQTAGDALLGVSMGARQFIGATRYSSGKALAKTLARSPCCVSLITEAGLLNKAEFGDSGGLKGMMLGLYQKSGAGRASLSAAYSSDENDTAVLHSPTFSMINESVPKSYLDYLRSSDAETNGDLPRFWTVIVGGKRPRRRRGEPVQPCFRGEVRARLLALIEDASATATNTPLEKCTEIELPEWMHDFEDEMKDKADYYEARGERTKANLYTRMALKIMKTCALFAVADGEREIKRGYFEWCRKWILEDEVDNIEAALNGDSDESVGAILTEARKIVLGLMKDKKKKTFTWREFHQVARKRRIFTKAENVRGVVKDGGLSALEALVKVRELVKIGKEDEVLRAKHGIDNRSGDVYLVMPALSHVMKG